MQWTLGKKLFSGVGAIFGLAVLMGGGGIIATRALNQELAQVGQVDALEGALAARTQYLVANLSVLVRQTVIAAARNQKEEVDAKMRETDVQIAELDTAWQELARITSDEQVRTLSTGIGTAMKAWAEQAKAAQRFAAAFQTAEAIEAIDASKHQSDSADKAAREILARQRQRLDEHVSAAEGRYTFTRNALVVLAISVLLIGSFVLYSVHQIVGTLNALATRLRRRSNHVHAASAQVSTSAQSLSRGATDQAASLEETSASIEEMSSMTQRNAQNSSEAASLMGQVDQRVAESHSALQDMLKGMTAIQDSSNKVAHIIKTIDEIAFQTNILALNAAVEAARAGAAGMGFAVVAEEVRNLAQRSGMAARDTAALIDESLARAREGNEKAQLVAGAVSAIIDTVSKAKSLVDEVSVASQQQAQGISQVSQAVAQMERGTQSTAATAEESAATSEELNVEASKTMEIVVQLEEMVGAEAVAEEPPAAAATAPSTRRAVVVAMPTQAKAAVPREAPSADGTYGSF